ncbi:50S ribosomal protein L24 [Candidatus Pacearchaeota archaeon]|nr:50S ribosomal protein L24P [uncultured archaeon]MBS3085454.1 50S ribosomal protein L24 [Candidatus Pacearchaeota archaeon]
MKQKFSKHWKASKQPRKQRKYKAKAPLHIKKKFLNVHLAKELRKRYGRKNLLLRKGDIIKIMRGEFKKKEGKVIAIKTKTSKVIIEGITVKKQEGAKVEVPIQASNLQVIELNLEDKKRLKGLNREKPVVNKSKEKNQEEKK